MKVLVVEDDPDMRFMIKMMLRSVEGLEVIHEAADATSALEQAKNCAPSVIILDNSLEGEITGLQIAPLLRLVAPDARIILFSAYDLAAEVEAEPAIDLFLRKDRVRQLPATVERVIASVV